MQEASGFQVMTIEAPSAQRSRVAIFYRNAEHFAIEDFHFHRPNIISFQLVTGRRRWHVLGCYIAPSNASTTESVTAIIRD